MKRVLFLVVLVIAGCGKPPRAEPVLDTTSLFPELTGVTLAPAADERGVPLAGVLAAALPGEGWRTYAGSGVTVLSHVSSDGTPDVLIWAEAFSSLADRSPSQEMRRFLVTVDPALVRRNESWPTVSPEPGLDREAVAAAMTRTGGRGIGFASSAEGFSGWRWVGSNTHGVFIRLATSRGTWGEPERLPVRLRGPVEQLVKRDPRLEWLRAGLPPQDGGMPRPAPVPATLIFGSASGEDGSVHLALLCRRTPTCALAADLAHFLGTLRSLEAADADEEALPFTEVSYDLGLPAVSSDALLDPLAPLP